MRTFGRTLSFSLSLALGLGAVSCGEDDGTTPGAAFQDAQIISDFADQVVVPTYALLAERADALQTAVTALEADKSTANLTAAQNAWKAARKPWEQSEGFLFGPVDSSGYDPAMDTWPLDLTALDMVLGSTDELTDGYVMGLGEELKGFHSIEFILFGLPAAPQTAASLTDRQLTLLVEVTEEFVGTTHALRDSWITGETKYRDVFATAGDGNTAYPSLFSAAQEIVTGMSGICDEVANGKIADPYDTGDPTKEESQFSKNSIVDFQDNMRSVQNAYLGSVPEADSTGRGLTTYVASVDAALDERVKTEIQAAIDAIGAIPEPFGEAITDPDAADEIEAAQAAIIKVQTTLDSDVMDAIAQ